MGPVTGPLSPWNGQRLERKVGMRASTGPWRLVSIVVAVVIFAGVFPLAGASREVIVESSGAIDTGIGAPVSWESPWGSGNSVPALEDPDVSVVRMRNDRQLVYVAQGDIPDFGALLASIQTHAGADPGSRVTVDSDGASYWLDLLRIEGDAFGSFAVGRDDAEVDVLTVYLGPVSEFADGFAEAQAAIAVGGEGIFDGVGGPGLQALLEANLPALGEASPASANDEPEAATPEATEVPAVDEDVPFAEAGMVGERSYLSPQFGVSIAWTSDWDLDYTFGDPVVSDRKQRFDYVNLLWNEDWSAWMAVTVSPMSWGSMEEFIGYAASDQATIDAYGDAATVAMSSASPALGGIVTLIDEGAADPTLVYEEYRFSADGGSLVQVLLVSLDPAVTQGAIEAAQEGITVDGEPVLVYYPPADVADVHGDVD
jgi:hypothetical protein